MPAKGLLERLRDGETVLVAEGYIFEFERRGYLRMGDFVPEVVLEHPDLVKAIYEEFVHAGSDVVQAFTYYAHREKLRHIGRVNILEEINRKALKMARQVADETGTLMAGNLSNTSAYKEGDPEAVESVRQIFKEQVEWAVEEGADFIIAETMPELGEAKQALEIIKKHGNGLPAVITLSVGREHTTYEGTPIVEAMKTLESLGADVVGLNCYQGPRTIMPLVEAIKKAVSIPVASLPVCYRTTEEYPAFLYLIDEDSGERAFPANLDAYACTRNQIREFGERCQRAGIQYVGLCCGNCAHYMRTLAETYGRKPPAIRFSGDMSKHVIFGTDESIGRTKVPGLYKKQ